MTTKNATCYIANNYSNMVYGVLVVKCTRDD